MNDKSSHRRRNEMNKNTQVSFYLNAEELAQLEKLRAYLIGDELSLGKWCKSYLLQVSKEVKKLNELEEIA
jgi:hypothetical protein